MIIDQVFEKRQTIITYKAKELTGMVADHRLTLREVNKGQVLLIRRYILDNIISGQIYLPPLVARLKQGSLDDGKPNELMIIDGTQRMKALTQLGTAISKLTNSEDSQEQRKGFKLLYMLDEVEIAVQIFEGLTQAEADQLYIDLNTKGKKVSLSKRIAYDSRDEINRITNRLLADNELLTTAGVEEEKISVMRPKNKKFVSLSQLRQLVGYFMTGKSFSGKLKLGNEESSRTEEKLDLINTWFRELFELYPAKLIGDYNHSMLASFPLLSAVARYAYDGLENEPIAVRKEIIQQRMRSLEHVDWSRNQTFWEKFDGSVRGKKNYFFLKNDKKTNNALVEWLRLEGGE